MWPRAMSVPLRAGCREAGTSRSDQRRTLPARVVLVAARSASAVDRWVRSAFVLDQALLGFQWRRGQRPIWCRRRGSTSAPAWPRSGNRRTS